MLESVSDLFKNTKILEDENPIGMSLRSALLKMDSVTSEIASVVNYVSKSKKEGMQKLIKNVREISQILHTVSEDVDETRSAMI